MIAASAASARCDLVVHGVPRPQGSKSAAVVGRVIKVNGKRAVVEPRAVLLEGKSGPQREAFEGWRAGVAAEARRWLRAHPGHQPWDCAVRLSVIFAMPRSASTPKRITRPIAKPDCSKLIRAVEDSLSKLIYSDDARIVELHVQKVYAAGAPYASIRVEPIGAEA